MEKINLIAYYLPQFHPIQENDEFWGKGFTEWTNVVKAKPLFKGHKQPKVPADLGFYDLRVPESRIAQAELAKSYGISGFSYWHYWFGNDKQVLNRPLQEVHKSGQPDFPFCIAWANQSWTGRWHGLDDKVIIEQLYLGREDDERHFYSILPYLKDKRYISYQGKLLIIIYKPKAHPYLNEFTKHWRSLALENGLGELYFLGLTYENGIIPSGLDGAILQDAYFTHEGNASLDRISKKVTGKKLRDYYNIITKGVKAYTYSSVVEKSNNHDIAGNIFPTILTGWDNTPRSGRNGYVFTRYSPELFRKHLIKVRGQLARNHTGETLCFIKSWNEWAEGNYLEPDQEYGHKFLEVLREVFPKNG